MVVAAVVAKAGTRRTIDYGRSLGNFDFSRFRVSAHERDFYRFGPGHSAAPREVQVQPKSYATGPKESCSHRYTACRFTIDT